MKPASDAPPRHGLAGGAAAPSPDWTIDQGWEHYTAQEHATWRSLFERQVRILRNRACAEYVAGMQALPIGPDQIPDFRRLNEVLARRTGWQVVAVPGLVPDAVFFEHLANRRFPAGQFIRRPQELDYLQEPDVFHDVFGHLPMLMNPIMADFIQSYGKGGLRALALGTLPMLARVYWYTVEFGLVEQDGGLRIYGSGIASSYGESLYCLDSPVPQRIRFQLPRVMRSHYRIDAFQQTYFVLKDISALLALERIDFLPLYRTVAALPELAPGAHIAEDEVLPSTPP